MIYAKDARKIVRNREDRELGEAANRLDRAQKKVDSIAKKAAWAFYSVIWKEFQGKRSEGKKRREDWAPIWKCIKGIHCTISYVELVVIVELAATCRRHVARRDVGSEGPSPTSCNEYFKGCEVISDPLTGKACAKQRTTYYYVRSGLLATDYCCFRKCGTPGPIRTRAAAFLVRGSEDKWSQFW